MCSGVKCLSAFHMADGGENVTSENENPGASDGEFHGQLALHIHKLPWVKGQEQSFFHIMAHVCAGVSLGLSRGWLL